MARSASLDLEVGGDVRRFQVTLGAWEKIQEATNMGPRRLYDHLCGNDWKPEELRVILEATLEAGSPDLKLLEVKALVKGLLEPGYWMQANMTAITIVAAALAATEDDEVTGAPGKSAAAAPPTQPSPTAS